MTIEFPIGLLNGTAIRQGNINAGNLSDTYGFTTDRPIEFFLQVSSPSASTVTRVYEDLNLNGTPDNGEFLFRESTSANQIDREFFNLRPGSFLARVESNSNGRNTNYSL